MFNIDDEDYELDVRNWVSQLPVYEGTPDYKHFICSNTDFMGSVIGITDTLCIIHLKGDEPRYFEFQSVKHGSVNDSHHMLDAYVVDDCLWFYEEKVNSLLFGPSIIKSLGFDMNMPFLDTLIYD